MIAPAGYGTAIAVEMARSAERAGAHGILLLPPYLTEPARRAWSHMSNRSARRRAWGDHLLAANAIYSESAVAQLVDACPNLIGFKDGYGNIELMTRIYAGIGDRLTYIGGLPTAEMFALPYLKLGVTTYSSAIFNFVPRFALDFYDALRRDDTDCVIKALNDFVIPYCNLRNRKEGYAVSIIKAGMKVIGRPAGPVRCPLTDLDEGEIAELADLIKKVNDVSNHDTAEPHRSLLIGADDVPGGAAPFQAVDPATGEQLDPVYHDADGATVDRAAELAWAAFALPPHDFEQRAAFLETIADEIEALGYVLVERVNAETGIPTPRVQGEMARTTGQLRLFADVVREGSWTGARLDTADPDRHPLPKPDLRQR